MHRHPGDNGALRLQRYIAFVLINNKHPGNYNPGIVDYVAEIYPGPILYSFYIFSRPIARVFDNYFELGSIEIYILPSSRKRNFQNIFKNVLFALHEKFQNSQTRFFHLDQNYPSRLQNLFNPPFIPRKITIIAISSIFTQVLPSIDNYSQYIHTYANIRMSRTPFLLFFVPFTLNLNP